MKRLDQSTIDGLPASVRRPGYDRTNLAPGMVHLGVGAFHRCHQAEFTDDMLEASFGPWGVIGINLRPPRLAPALGPQDCLYVRSLTADGSEPDRRAIGSLRAALDVEGDPGPALSVLADPRIGVVTMTVTERAIATFPRPAGSTRLIPMSCTISPIPKIRAPCRAFSSRPWSADAHQGKGRRSRC